MKKYEIKTFDYDKRVGLFDNTINVDESVNSFIEENNVTPINVSIVVYKDSGDLYYVASLLYYREE